MKPRISREQAFLEFANIMSYRSTCDRARVGAIITDARGLQILGIGYNGNAAGLSNTCDNAFTPGKCGCIHAEINALLKAPGAVPDKLMFITTAPCLHCAKLIVNGGIVKVHFLNHYRDNEGLQLLNEARILWEKAPRW